MPPLSALRVSLIALALTALAGPAFVSAAYADSNSISFSIIKAGLIVGGAGGSGTLNFQGRSYRSESAVSGTASLSVHPRRAFAAP